MQYDSLTIEELLTQLSIKIAEQKNEYSDSTYRSIQSSINKIKADIKDKKDIQHDIEYEIVCYERYKWGGLKSERRYLITDNYKEAMDKLEKLRKQFEPLESLGKSIRVKVWEDGKLRSFY